MPTYEFLNRNTNNVEEHMVKIADLEKFLIDNPDLEKVVLTAPSIGDPVRLGVKRTDDGWRETLQRVAEKTPGGQVLKDSIR